VDRPAKVGKPYGWEVVVDVMTLDGVREKT
jgi:hypothetical protein